MTGLQITNLIVNIMAAGYFGFWGYESYLHIRAHRAERLDK